MRADVPDFRHRVRTLVVIASSSRGGSSVLAEMLRRSADLLHFRAEVNPFFVLSGLGYPASGASSDRLDASQAADGASVRALDRYLSLDCGHISDAVTPELREALSVEWARRLTMQWPQERFSLEEVREAVRDAASQERAMHSPDFQAVLLSRIRARHPAVDPWYYDLPPAAIERHHPHQACPQAPPSEVVIEEPPFVTVRPWMLAPAAALAEKPVVVKTPSNVYRLGFLRAFFPNARLRVLHLVRNAAASINGLVDGWGYRGFFAHRMAPDLAITGYSDRFAWGREWWKFDLPPGWEAFKGRTLVDVCAFQWLSAHEATLAFLEQHADVDVLRLRFENVVGDEPQRREAFGRLASWLGIRIEGPFETLVREGVPPVMATVPPRQRRWFQKADLLEPALSSRPIIDMMERLGYANDPDTWL